MSLPKQVYYNRSDIARAAKKSSFWIADLIQRGKIPAPRFQIGLRYYYTPEEAEAVLAEVIRRERKTDQ